MLHPLILHQRIHDQATDTRAPNDLGNTSSPFSTSWKHKRQELSLSSLETRRCNNFVGKLDGVSVINPVILTPWAQTKCYTIQGKLCHWKGGASCSTWTSWILFLCQKLISSSSLQMDHKSTNKMGCIQEQYFNLSSQFVTILSGNFWK